MCKPRLDDVQIDLLLGVYILFLNAQIFFHNFVCSFKERHSFDLNTILYFGSDVSLLFNLEKFFSMCKCCSAHKKQ